MKQVRGILYHCIQIIFFPVCSMADASSLVSEGQNSCMVKCVHCDSRVLSPQSATFLSKSHPLPTPTQPKDQPSPNTEDVRTIKKSFAHIDLIRICSGVFVFSGPCYLYHYNSHDLQKKIPLWCLPLNCFHDIQLCDTYIFISL